MLEEPEMPPEIQALEDNAKDILAVTRFDLPQNIKTIFQILESGTRWDTPLPEVIRLTQRGGARIEWRERLHTAIVNDVQEGLAACYYHLSNIEAIECRIMGLRIDRPPISFTVDGGNTRQLTFEYQAFVFSLRRTMEYLAVSIGAFFKRDAHSIRTIASIIRDSEPTEIRNSLVVTLDSRLKDLGDVLPPNKGNKRSVRDRLAHWDAVSAGRIQVIVVQGKPHISFSGGGEELSRGKLFEDVRISPGLRNQVKRVESLIFDVYVDMGLLKKAKGGSDQ